MSSTKEAIKYLSPVSKLQARNTYDGHFQYVASFFKHASFKDLDQLYNTLDVIFKDNTIRTGFLDILESNAEKNPELSGIPTEFFKTFGALKKVIHMPRRANFIWHKLYNYIMEYESIDTKSPFIETLYDLLPRKFDKTYRNNISALKTRRRT